MRLWVILILLGAAVFCHPQVAAAVLSDNGNGTVTDTRTGLIWQQGEPGSMVWGDALTYCEGLLSLGGRSDWRLPNVKELESLTDDTRYNPAVDSSFFPYAHASGYWSSTAGAYGPGGAWGVYFGDGYVGYNDKYGSGYVRCVRGGQSGSLGYSIIGNAGVANAVVTLSGAASQTVTSAADGSFSFISLSAGGYTVTPTRTGFTFTPALRDVTVNNQDVTVPAFTATAIDTSPPVINSLTLPATSSTLNVPVTLDATDNAGIAGYYLSENGTTPALGASGWSATLPTSFTFAGSGLRTLYVWVKDAAGNLSARSSSQVTINVKQTLGDPNSDGIVNVFDALLTLQYAVGLIEHNPGNDAWYKSTADVAPLDANGKPKSDGVVNVFDALAILRHAVGLDAW